MVLTQKARTIAVNVCTAEIGNAHPDLYFSNPNTATPVGVPT
jgi:hypothetical protein